MRCGRAEPETLVPKGFLRASAGMILKIKNFLFRIVGLRRNLKTTGIEATHVPCFGHHVFSDRSMTLLSLPLVFLRTSLSS